MNVSISSKSCTEDQKNLKVFLKTLQVEHPKLTLVLCFCVETSNQFMSDEKSHEEEAQCVIN